MHQKLNGVCCCIEDFFFHFSQNGIVEKDLTRLKMLLSEIEVSVSGYRAAKVTVVLPCSCLLVLVGFTDEGLMLAGESH